MDIIRWMHLCSFESCQAAGKMAKALALILIGFFITDGSWTLGLQEAVVCEGRNSTMSCGAGETIYITYANYGRQDRTTCPDPRILSTNCYSLNSSDIIEKSCDGRRSCTLFANNYVFGDTCVGTHKYIRVFYLCGIRVKQRVVLCEGERLRIQCYWYFVISIDSASYGRQEKNTCTSLLINTTSCSANQSKKIVKKQCQYKNSCLLQANNSVFGDPCKGTSKYLSVTYRCIRPESKVVFVCQGRQRLITCPSGETIDIQYARYGKTSRRTCRSSSFRNTYCYAPNWKSKMAASCNGKRRCLLQPFNPMFGDPCAEMYKYFRVRYYCK